MRAAARLAVALAALLLLAAACGQYPNVHERAVAEAGGAPGAAGTTGSAAAQGNSGDVSGLGGGAKVSGGGGAGSGTGSGRAGGGFGSGSSSGTVGSSGASGSGGSGISGGSSGPSGSSGSGRSASRPGRGHAWGSTIVIGIHAPITGAAPVRVDSFNSEKDLFWKYGNNLHPVTVSGRHVKVVVQDDQYNPSHAQQVCQQMVVQDHAFMLVGGAGTDQIVACAQYAQSVGVPYLSAGVTQGALSRFGNYFSLSETYVQQASPLAKYIKRAFHASCGQVKMIAEDTPNFDDAVSAFLRACPGTKVERVPKNDNGGQYGTELCTGTISNYRAVYPLVSPIFFLQMTGAAQACKPQYTGIGITQGIDVVADTFCKQGGRSGELQFFSPAPAFANSDRFDPTFRKAAAKAGVKADDIGWLLWGLNATLRELLMNAGSNLSRPGFVNRTSTARVSVNGYAHLEYAPSNHFGARTFSVLTNVCSGGGGHCVTRYANVSGF
jgi:branched-chain amino acid transport system substrate-binding protein